jgi:hypothetical protein
MYPTLIPAFGRDYKSKKEVEADFAAGKDFILLAVPGQGRDLPANKQSLTEARIANVNVRYAKLTKVAVLKVG